MFYDFAITLRPSSDLFQPSKHRTCCGIFNKTIGGFLKFSVTDNPVTDFYNIMKTVSIEIIFLLHRKGLPINSCQVEASCFLMASVLRDVLRLSWSLSLEEECSVRVWGTNKWVDEQTLSYTFATPFNNLVFFCPVLNV